MEVVLLTNRLSDMQAMYFPIEIWEMLKPSMAPWEWARLCCTNRALYALRDQVFLTEEDSCALQQCRSMLMKAIACMLALPCSSSPL